MLTAMALLFQRQRQFAPRLPSEREAMRSATRGGHYHHAKTEKFLVLKGTARFRFLNMDTGETHSIDTTGEQSLIVETVPGWSHDITNIGEDELICMLWANELFDRERPDTVAHPLTHKA